MIITLDGPSGSGKSTLACRLAKILRFDYLDTGAHYRTLTYWLVTQHIDWNDPIALQKGLASFEYTVRKIAHETRYYVGSEDVTENIRLPAIHRHISEICSIDAVRTHLVRWQRSYAQGRYVVVDGRDMGSVVFPDAVAKFFITADVMVRAQRRYKEFIAKGTPLSFDEVRESMILRDHQDVTREISPLLKAEDAWAVDTSLLSLSQVEKLLLCHLKERAIYPYRMWKKRVFGESFARSHFFYIFCRCCVNGLLMLICRRTVYGKENIPRGKAIIAPNHVSFLDPPVTGLAVAEEVFFLAQEYLFAIPLFGFCIRRLNALPIRGNASDKSVLQGAIHLLRSDRKIMVFPEGERSRDGKLRPLKRGVSLLASLADSPVIPVYLSGCYEAWPRHKKFPRLFSRCIIVIGRPLYPEDFACSTGKKERQQAMSNSLKNRILDLKKWVTDGCKGAIP